jgi:hypothetical protein
VYEGLRARGEERNKCSILRIGSIYRVQDLCVPHSYQRLKKTKVAL